jgi:hypothetical protein
LTAPLLLCLLRPMATAGCPAGKRCLPVLPLACYLRIVPAADVLAKECLVNGHTTLEAHFNQDVLESVATDTDAQDTMQDTPWNSMLPTNQAAADMRDQSRPRCRNYSDKSKA